MNVVGAVTAPVRGVVSTIALLPRVLEAILVLPHVAEQLDRVRENTEALPVMLTEIEAIRADTRSLPLVETELRAMGLTLARIDRNTLAVEQMAETVAPLQGAAVRVGRFADRLPQRRFAARNGNGTDAPT